MQREMNSPQTGVGEQTKKKIINKQSKVNKQRIKSNQIFIYVSLQAPFILMFQNNLVKSFGQTKASTATFKFGTAHTSTMIKQLSTQVTITQ